VSQSVIIGLRWLGSRLQECIRFDHGQGIFTDEWRNVPTFVEQRLVEQNHVARTSKYDWNSVDWTKPVSQIAEEMGASPVTVYWKRRKLGIQAPRARTRHMRHRSWRYHDVDWESLDWTKNNNQLARETGIPFSTIRQNRIKLGKPNSDPRTWYSKQRKVSPEQLETVDWEHCTDTEIAHQLRVSRERIRQLRQTLCKPPCKWDKVSKSVRDMLFWMESHRAELEGKTTQEIFEAMPFPHATRGQKYYVLRMSGISYDATTTKAAISRIGKLSKQINWELPNIILSKIWGETAQHFASYRSHWNLGKAKWLMQGGFCRVTDELRAAAHAELAKANGTITPEALDQYFDAREQFIKAKSKSS
jgi:hypothetical protein